jgi:hypothetical protein
MSRALILSAATGAIILAGCHSLGGPAPALLTSNDAAAMARLEAALAEAMGQAKVVLGPGDPTQSPNISVLPQPPGPLEDRSLVLPTRFRLEIEWGQCFVVREDGGVRKRIEGLGCRPA